MKVLFAIQGTGNGHLSRAKDIIPLLHDQVEVDLLVSGIQADVTLPYPVKYQFKGFSYVFGKKGGIDLWETWKKCDIRQLLKDINELPVKDYQLVISDFEPVSTWACLKRGIKAVGISHQNAVLHPMAPKPGKFHQGAKWIMRFYAPTTFKYGFHFKAWGENNYTPIVRQQIRQAIVQDHSHITVYLPPYDNEKLIRVFSKIEKVRWEVFSKHNHRLRRHKNVIIYPIDDQRFVRSIVTSHGVLCGAGFETPSEALFLGKKLMVVPMKGQYEQSCNATALRSMGVPVIKSLKLKYLPEITAWVEHGQNIKVAYSDQTSQIIETILTRHLYGSVKDSKSGPMSLSDYKRLAFS